MTLLDKLKNNFIYGDKYKTDSEAVIISCYFNPQNNPYRLSAFKEWYSSIKHLNHRVIECVIGDSKPQLGFLNSPYIETIQTPNVLWHKEALLNKIVSELPKKFKYIFWVDADVLFTNKNWVVDGVKELKIKNIIQPFEYCVHLEKDELEPSYEVDLQLHAYKAEKLYKTGYTGGKPKTIWRSFCANYVTDKISANSDVYDTHGHVGFAWGAKREVLERVPLYDHALVGGADHIIAHASAGQIGHTCITKSFTENINIINMWSQKFYNVVGGSIGYVKGDLYHIWHGTLESREYLKRVKEFTPKSKGITEKDKNGLYVTKDDSYVKKYFDKREVKPNLNKPEYQAKRQEFVRQYPNQDDSFIDSLMWAYITDSSSMGMVMGGNPAGAIIGDMLNESDNQPTEYVEANNDTYASDSTTVDNIDLNENFS